MMLTFQLQSKARALVKLLYLFLSIVLLRVIRKGQEFVVNWLTRESLGFLSDPLWGLDVLEGPSNNSVWFTLLRR